MMIDFKYDFLKLLLVSDGCFVLIRSNMASFYDVVHLWTIDWVLFLDIHMQILYLRILT